MADAEMMSFEEIYNALKRENEFKLQEINIMIMQLEAYVMQLRATLESLKALKAMLQAA